MNLTFLFAITVFCVGLYFYASGGVGLEGFTNSPPTLRCPDMLIQKDSRFYLYNSKLARVPGVNPIEFEHLEDYTEFLDWQHSQGIRCPVLYLQSSYDAQGNEVYKVRPSVSEPQGGLPPSSVATSVATTVATNPMINPGGPVGEGPAGPVGGGPVEPAGKPLSPNPTLLVDATHDDPPYNRNAYPAYDPSSYYVGTTTPLDKKPNPHQKSANPMDDNWGGSAYTQSLVDKGVYKDDEVQIYIP